MFDYTHTKNSAADHRFFNDWMIENYTNYDGYTDSGADPTIHLTVALTAQEETDVWAFYDGLDEDDVYTNEPQPTDESGLWVDSAPADNDEAITRMATAIKNALGPIA